MTKAEIEMTDQIRARLRPVLIVAFFDIAARGLSADLLVGAIQAELEAIERDTKLIEMQRQKGIDQ